MFMRSTGLGRTLLTAKVANIEATTVVPSTLEQPQGGAREPMRMMLVMEVVNPVHWTVRAFMDPSDLRKMVKILLTNPSLLLKGVKFFFSKDTDYGQAGVKSGPAKAPAKAGPETVSGPAPITSR